MAPNSSQTKSPQSEKAKPMTQSIRNTPTDPTEPRMNDGVENIPVPMIVPTLVANVRKYERSNRMVGHLSTVQLKTPRWQPVLLAVSSAQMHNVDGVLMSDVPSESNPASTILAAKVTLILSSLSP